MKILIIGDAHISEHDDLRRFKAMVKVIKKFKPNKILIIGDFLTMDCLSAWDKNKKKIMEGKRFKNEIEKGNEALDIIQEEFKGEVIYLEGNHEERLERYLDIQPTFDGVVNIPIQLKLAERKIKWVKFKEFYNINGISFTHIPIAGNGRPIGGTNLVKKALSMFSNSVVFGHTHSLKFDHETRHNSGMNKALNVGCYFEEGHDYTKGSTQDHWKGLIILETLKLNDFDYQTISLDSIMSNYKDDGVKSKVIIDKEEKKPIKKTTSKRVVKVERVAYDYSGDKHV